MGFPELYESAPLSIVSLLVFANDGYLTVVPVEIRSIATHLNSNQSDFRIFNALYRNVVFSYNRGYITQQPRYTYSQQKSFHAASDMMKFVL